MRPEFLQAMQELCHAYDALFVLDEVQTGVGLTGTPWAYQQLGLEPDVVAFAKKVQLGGIMAGRRVDEVADNVFAVSGRINSTWGGGLADMVRSRRLLEIIERDGLIDHAAKAGNWLLGELRALAERHAGAGVERPRARAHVRVRPAQQAAPATPRCGCCWRSTSSCCPAGSGRYGSGPPWTSPSRTSRSAWPRSTASWPPLHSPATS